MTRGRSPGRTRGARTGTVFSWQRQRKWTREANRRTESGGGWGCTAEHDVGVNLGADDGEADEREMRRTQLMICDACMTCVAVDVLVGE